MGIMRNVNLSLKFTLLNLKYFFKHLNLSDSERIRSACENFNLGEGFLRDKESMLLIKLLCKKFNLKLMLLKNSNGDLTVFNSDRALVSKHETYYLYNKERDLVYDFLLGYYGLSLSDWVCRTHVALRHGKGLMVATYEGTY